MSYEFAGLGPFPDADRLAQAITSLRNEQTQVRVDSGGAGIYLTRSIDQIHYQIGEDGHSAVVAYYEAETRIDSRTPLPLETPESSDE